jgi:outer membrane protein OmpA-like peptidoglycan-associated protein
VLNCIVFQRNFFIALLCICSVLPVFGQQTTVINHFAGDTTGVGTANMRLKHSEEHTIIIHYYETVSEQDHQRLNKVIDEALAYYLDQSVMMDEHEVILRKKPSKMMKDMNGIVKDVVKYYNLKEIEGFEGFSEELERRIEVLADLNWKGKIDRLAEARGSGGRSEEEKAYRYVQSFLSEAKHQASKEVGIFSIDNLMAYSGSSSSQLSQEQKEALLADVEGFKKNDPLAPIEIDFSLSTMNMIAAADDTSLPEFEGGRKDTKDQSDFAEKVFELLRENNARLQTLENEVSAIKNGNTAPPQAENNSLQSQIDELREVVLAMALGQTSNPGTSANSNSGSNSSSNTATENAIDALTSNLPESFDIYFRLGGSTLDLNAEMMIAELVDILAKNPRLRIMVSGYADKVGNPARNLQLSKERARKVRARILMSGIQEQRVMFNFFGDGVSDQGSNPDDRRVNIQFMSY